MEGEPHDIIGWRDKFNWCPRDDVTSFVLIIVVVVVVVVVVVIVVVVSVVVVAVVVDVVVSDYRRPTSFVYEPGIKFYWINRVLQPLALHQLFLA